MFNKKAISKKAWLVIEKNVYTTPLETFTVAKKAYSLDEAIEFKLALEKLNDRDNQSYFIATDVGTATDTMISVHNKSVADGSYYKKHPEVKNPNA